MKSFAVAAVLAMLSVTAYAGIRPYSPVQPKSILSEIVEVIVNNLRPKLENLKIELLDLGEHGSVTDLTLTNLETFGLTMDAPGALSFKIQNLTVVIDWASADATYNFINIEVPEVGVTLNGQGKLGGRAEGIRVSVALDCKLQGLTTLQIEDFHDLEVNLDRLVDVVLETIDQADVDAVAGYIPKWIADNYQQLVEENKQAILDKINEVLAGLS